MNLERQSELLLSIYSIEYLLKCNVVELEEKFLVLCPVSGKTDMFQMYDPVVIVTAANGIDTVPADVTSVDMKSGHVKLYVRDEGVDDERRVFERYPVSLEISARKKYSSKRLHMLVKNISLYGMGTISDVELEEEELIDIDLITDRNMFYFSGKVIWKNTLDNRFYEYGLQLTHYDVATQYMFQEYLKKQKTYYFNMISKAR